MTRIVKKGESTQLEKDLAKAIDDIQAGAEEEARNEISKLKITGAKDVTVEGLRIFIIVVPYKQIAAYHRLQAFIVGELEKKLGFQVFIVAKRRAFPKTPVRGRAFRAIRPVGRTLRSVQEALLQDVVYPASIIGKRVHYDLNRNQTTKVILDPQDKTTAEDRLAGYGIAYRSLTGLKTTFEIANA